MSRNAGLGLLPTVEQEEGFSLLILAYFIFCLLYFSSIVYINKLVGRPI